MPTDLAPMTTPAFCSEIVVDRGINGLLTADHSPKHNLEMLAWHGLGVDILVSTQLEEKKKLSKSSGSLMDDIGHTYMWVYKYKVGTDCYSTFDMYQVNPLMKYVKL